MTDKTELELLKARVAELEARAKPNSKSHSNTTTGKSVRSNWFCKTVSTPKSSNSFPIAKPAAGPRTSIG
jgi:hypothetical protein